MYLIGKYESALAQVKHARSYWFFPLEKIATLYHISPRFSGTGLRGLVELGALQVVPGQFSITAPGDQFGKANRYYFQGLEEVADRKRRMEEVRDDHPRQFAVAEVLSRKLINGATTKNVAGLWERLITSGDSSGLGSGHPRSDRDLCVPTQADPTSSGFPPGVGGCPAVGSPGV